MSENKVCIICNEVSAPSKKLHVVSNYLVKCCNERLSLGELEMKQLCDRLNSLSETENKNQFATIMNAGNR